MIRQVTPHAIRIAKGKPVIAGDRGCRMELSRGRLFIFPLSRIDVDLERCEAVCGCSDVLFYSDLAMGARMVR